jgi:hypothetical protein
MLAGFPLLTGIDAVGLLSPEPLHARGEVSHPALELGTRRVEYGTAMRKVFADIISGRLDQAGPLLLEESDWLLGHVTDLGERLNH